MIKIDIQKKLEAADGPMLLKLKGELHKGQLLAIYGASGVGKSSLLRILAGLMEPDEGRIEVNGELWLDSRQKLNIKSQRRNVGLVFQEYALFPHMSVRQNLQYALGKGKDSDLIDELIDITGLSALQHRIPAYLSGGQQQRVAVARAIVRKPQLLMLDEPFSALDEEMREQLQNYLSEIHKKYKLTTILVSHDVPEICKLADQIWEIERGEIQRKGKPVDIFAQKQISGKFQFVGRVLSIEKADILRIISVLVGSQIVRVACDPQTAQSIKEGDKVLVVTKAYNPIIQKLT